MSFKSRGLFANQELMNASDFTVTFKTKGQKAVYVGMRVEKSCYNAADNTFLFQVRSRLTNDLYIFGVKAGEEITGATMGEPV